MHKKDGERTEFLIDEPERKRPHEMLRQIREKHAKMEKQCEVV
jgi:hypothetical protein